MKTNPPFENNPPDLSSCWLGRERGEQYSRTRGTFSPPALFPPPLPITRSQLQTSQTWDRHLLSMTYDVSPVSCLDATFALLNATMLWLHILVVNENVGCLFLWYTPTFHPIILVSKFIWNNFTDPVLYRKIFSFQIQYKPHYHI